ncbi:putative nucleic acid-binding protein, contains PIN domain [Thermococcus nautili]|uniref:Putative nucleic acid-binding protein, contains PIN domain n=1 Tax=Thermococcus nautili TaxID=195522 RepID=W8P113_9EURY|nr:putative nucleic acid-binding protein, contains PIN domain [Thermococcus nautili]
MDTSVLYNYLVETSLTEYAVEVIESREGKVTSDTVVDELFYALIRKLGEKEYGARSIWKVKELLRSNSEFRKRASEVISDILALLDAKKILLVSDSRDWLTIATLIHDYSLLPHDARILATALEYNCDKLATLDEDFGAVKDIIELFPEDFWQKLTTQG